MGSKITFCSMICNFLGKTEVCTLSHKNYKIPFLYFFLAKKYLLKNWQNTKLVTTESINFLEDSTNLWVIFFAFIDEDLGKFPTAPCATEIIFFIILWPYFTIFLKQNNNMNFGMVGNYN